MPIVAVHVQLRLSDTRKHECRERGVLRALDMPANEQDGENTEKRPENGYNKIEEALLFDSKQILPRLPGNLYHG